MKIFSELITELGHQITIFIIIYYAVIENNHYAETAFYIYVWIVGVMSILMIVLNLLMLNKTPHGLKINYLKNLKFDISDLDIMSISTIFSIIEIAIFVNYNLWGYATVWLFGEIAAYAYKRLPNQNQL